MRYDFIVIGSGMGGMSAAALLAKYGFRVLTLEAAHVPGGCSSSYVIKKDGRKFVFESGATTIVGLDDHQPLNYLERELNMKFPVVELNPSMTVHISGKTVTRYKHHDQWIQECYDKFFAGTSVAYERVSAFWKLVFELSDFVWKVSERNAAFPPESVSDVWELYKKNPIGDFPKLVYLFTSAFKVMCDYGLDASDDFRRFCDEQLMITAQASCEKVPMLYAAPCLAYTSSSNYYAYGGMISMMNALVEKYQSLGGEIAYRARVTHITQLRDKTYQVNTESGNTFEARNLISNATIWNMAEMTDGKLQCHFQKLSKKFPFGWGAFTMSLAVENTLPDDLSLHHQLILDGKVPFCNSDSIFVSLSMPDDRERQPDGTRLLAVSTHTKPDVWFTPEDYAQKKSVVENFILSKIEQTIPGFSREKMLFKNASTPKSWQEWVYRKQGRVGGIPNTLEKNVFELVGAATPFKNLYLVGDTVYPGQGMAGVCLSGRNAVYRALQHELPPLKLSTPTRSLEKKLETTPEW